MYSNEVEYILKFSENVSKQEWVKNNFLILLTLSAVEPIITFSF